MHILIVLLVGAVIGWIAGVLMRTEAQTGLLLNIIIGIVGSALGHYLAPSLGVLETSTVVSLLVSIGGAVLLIVILRALRVLR